MSTEVAQQGYNQVSDTQAAGPRVIVSNQTVASNRTVTSTITVSSTRTIGSS